MTGVYVAGTVTAGAGAPSYNDINGAVLPAGDHGGIAAGDCEITGAVHLLSGSSFTNCAFGGTITDDGNPNVYLELKRCTLSSIYLSGDGHTLVEVGIDGQEGTTPSSNNYAY